MAVAVAALAVVEQAAGEHSQMLELQLLGKQKQIH